MQVLLGERTLSKVENASEEKISEINVNCYQIIGRPFWAECVKTLHLFHFNVRKIDHNVMSLVA